MTTSALTNAFREVIKNKPDDQYAKYAAESSNDKILAHLKTVELFYPDSALLLCNRSHPNLTYISDSIENIIGYSSYELRNMDMSEFSGRIHPDDRPDLYQCLEHISSYSPYHPVNHRFTLHYRFKNKDEKYVPLRDEKLAIEAEGKFIYFAKFQTLPASEKFLFVQLEVDCYANGTLQNQLAFCPTLKNQQITERQQEIIKLISKGLSTQEIADRLRLSVNTIKNHKQNIFRKTKVKSSVELLMATR